MCGRGLMAVVEIDSHRIPKAKRPAEAGRLYR
jgi:hypothetical protein